MNAARLLAFDERAAAAGEALWPCVVRIGGTDYAAQAPKPRVNVIDLQGSTETVAELHVRLRKINHPEEPEIEQVLRAHGRDWWIREVRANDADAAWLLRCEARN
jgi:hypothetical protein